MPRNMVIGKLSTRLDRQVEIPSTLFELGSHVATCECRSGHDPATNRGVGLCTRGGWPCPQPGKKGEKLRGCSLGTHACELGLPCKVKKLDSNRSLLAVNETT